MDLTLARERHVSDGATPTLDPDSDTVVYQYRSGHRFAAIGFHGRARKPRWHLIFPSAERRHGFVTGYLESRRTAQRERQRETRPHSLTVGTVLSAQWGYEQTNVNFYEVTRVMPKSVELREIAQARMTTGFMCGTCVPVQGNFTGDAILRRVSGSNAIRVDDSCYAQRWDGRPQRWSAYA